MSEAVTIYDGPDVCQTCLGWKRVDNAEGYSWKHWAELTPPSNVSVQMGLVKPVVCVDCYGTGKARHVKHDDNGRRSYAELVADLVDRAREWREAEIHEFETDSCKEREERHCATYSALCRVRKAVFDLFPHLDNDSR